MTVAPVLTGHEADQELDIDSLHILPLSIIPLETPGLARARLIKNSNLDSVIELYHDDAAGSGQLDPSQLGKVFNWKGAEGYEDQRVISALSQLSSYDVYSLRIELRRLGIEVNDVDALKLSDQKKAELTGYMRAFTSPLLREVYGNADVDVNDFDHLLQMFANPDRKAAIENLKKMAERLDIEVFAVPAFLEEYADVFLSLAYYKHCLDDLIPKITSFLEAMRDLQNSHQMRSDAILMDACSTLSKGLNDITASITGRFESFDRHSQSMWDNLSAESFRRVRSIIESHHTTVGGVLCGLWLKMSIWEDQGGRRKRGGPVQRAEFIMSHMRSGMGRIKEIEDSAPYVSDL